MPKKLREIYAAAWLVTVLVTLGDVIWAHVTDFRIENSSAVHNAKMITGVFAISGLFLAISRRSHKNPSRKSFYENVAHSFLWIAVLVAYTCAAVVFQYLSVTTDFPLVSDALVSADSALGFHWLETYRWVHSHQWAHFVLQLAYASGGVQLVVIPVVLALTSNSEDYAELAMQFIVSATLVILIAILLPAESAFVHFGVHDADTVSTVSDYAPLRSGTMRGLVFASAQGIISFPSFHSILALCFAYSLRHVRFLFIVGVVLNFMMILSTPTQGGHYLLDVLAGLITGVSVIYFVRKFFVEPADVEFFGVKEDNLAIGEKK